ncbi:MAG: NADP-dependent oxidoreductase, partial [Gammaproteobacteria bacterium]
MTTSREVHLLSRPQGMPRREDFAIVSTEVPEPGPGEFLLRNI